MTSSKHGETLDTLLTREQREELTALVTSACNRMRENICTTFDALPATPPAQTPPAPTSQQDPSEKLSAQHLDGQKLENIPPQTSETKPDSGGSELTQPKSETVQLPTNPQLEILKKNCLSSFDEWQEPIIKRIKEVVDPKNVSGKSGSATEVSAENDAQNDILQSMYPPIETSLLALPQAHRNTVLQSLLLLFLSLGNYDSRSRVLLLVIASSLHIPLAVALEQEDHTANTIIKAAEKSKDMTAEEESKKRVEENKFSRGWKIGLASVAGAAVIGITGKKPL